MVVAAFAECEAWLESLEDGQVFARKSEFLQSQEDCRGHREAVFLEEALLFSALS